MNTTSLAREIALKMRDTAITTREMIAVAGAVDEVHTSEDRIRLSSLSVVTVQGRRKDITQIKHKCQMPN